jgi:hypothetical protein
MFFNEPTHWECNEHRMKSIGRPVLFRDTRWEFVAEPDLQKRQSNTLHFLAARKLTEKKD